MVGLITKKKKKKKKKYSCHHRYVIPQQVSGRVSAFYAKGPRFNRGPGILFVCLLSHASNCSIYYLLHMMHVLTAAKPGLLNTFSSLVNKRLCSPGMKHYINV